jgi:hypothetical protein
MVFARRRTTGKGGAKFHLQKKALHLAHLDTPPLANAQVNLLFSASLNQLIASPCASIYFPLPFSFWYHGRPQLMGGYLIAL